MLKDADRRVLPLLAPVKGRFTPEKRGSVAAGDTIGRVVRENKDDKLLKAPGPGEVRWWLAEGAEVVSGTVLGQLTWTNEVIQLVPRVTAFQSAGDIPVWLKYTTGGVLVASVTAAYLFYLFGGGFEAGASIFLLPNTLVQIFHAFYLSQKHNRPDVIEAPLHPDTAYLVQLELAGLRPPDPHPEGGWPTITPHSRPLVRLRNGPFSREHLEVLAQHPDGALAATAAARLAAGGDTRWAWPLLRRRAAPVRRWALTIIGEFGNEQDLERLVLLRRAALGPWSYLFGQDRKALRQLQARFPDDRQLPEEKARHRLEVHRLAAAARRELVRSEVEVETPKLEPSPIPQITGRELPLDRPHSLWRLGLDALPWVILVPILTVLAFLLPGAGWLGWIALGMVALGPAIVGIGPARTLYDRIRTRSDRELLYRAGVFDRTAGQLALVAQAGEGDLSRPVPEVQEDSRADRVEPGVRLPQDAELAGFEKARPS